MSRKRPHLFGGSFSNERNVLPRFARDIMPELSTTERMAARQIRRHLTAFVQRRRGLIGATVGAGAALAAEFIRGKASGNTPRVQQSVQPDIPTTSIDTGSTDQESKSSGHDTKSIETSSVENMTGATPMHISTHGDGASNADQPFNRDGEDKGKQQAIAASLWHRAPRIYDDEIIVRMPLIPTFDTSSATNPMEWTPTLAAAGPPIVPSVQLFNAFRVQVNNIFTPFTNDTSLKPRGYAWYSQLYNYYQVLECRWKYITNAISCGGSNAAATNLTANQPVHIYATIGDNSHTAFASDRALMELGYTNGADKSIVIKGPAQITDMNGLCNKIPRTITFEGTWTPAMFEDLQTNITFQPMTAIGSNPNWINYLDFGSINYNTTAASSPMAFQTYVYLEFLVHFKKVNMTKYATGN